MCKPNSRDGPTQIPGDVPAIPCLKQQKKAPCIKFLSRISQCRGQGLSGRHRGIASLVSSHRGSASQRISAARTRIARIFASHRIAIPCLPRTAAHIASLPASRDMGHSGQGYPSVWVPDVPGISCPKNLSLGFVSVLKFALSLSLSLSPSLYLLGVVLPHLQGELFRAMF